ncbi:hypothetical protein EXIGLDRAFT_775651 [Exidia glandulosa HHB12029]|uniref:Uncharacterized protein n=1 Tax=Exidia glandulosa HHB12029 TaxID=1314781 RepID=A0A165DU50_EXIGL|nr:hypothetical protein EXIGLDRAFT_775651 [Exidia glandulosa HHB12029]
MTDLDFAQAQRQRDEQTLMALYEQRAQAQARKRSHDDELERAQRALERAAAGSRVAAIDLVSTERIVQLQLDAILARSASISPIHRLSPELLLQIFYHLLNGRDWGSQPSFLAASVCTRWRKLALGSPRLWSISLNLERRPAHIAEYVKMVFARTGDTALRISILSPPQIHTLFMHTLDNVLPDVITRAGDLAIKRRDDHSPHNLSDTIYKFLQLPTPHLYRLHVSGFDFQEGEARLLPAAPMTASLSCSLGSFPEVSVQSLHEISLLLQRERPDLALLHATAPRLRRLTFRRYPDCRIRGLSEPATLPHLEFLELDGVDILSSFPHNGLPALMCLSMRAVPPREDESLPLPAMPLLRDITLHDTSDWLSILPSFQQVQQVETLVLSSKQFASSRVRGFWLQWAQRNRVEALPRLRNITIHGADSKPSERVPGQVDFLEAHAALSADDTATFGKLPLLTLKNTALPRWELLRLEGAVERIAFI